MTVEIIKDEASVYHSRRAISNSGLSRFLDCPAKFVHFLNNMDGGDDKQTEALLTGSVLHSMVLEPEKTEDIYGLQTLPGNTKDGKAELAKIREAGKIPVKAAMWDMCAEMAESIRKTQPLAYIADPAAEFMAEHSIYWTHHEMPCKARLDGYISNKQTGLEYIIDLKTTTDASLRGIQKSIFKYGYHRQVAWYLHAARLAGLNPVGFIFIFVEKEPPYVTTCATISEAAIAYATDEIRMALERIEECKQTGVWPGYSPDPIFEIGLPIWMQNQTQTQEL